MSSNIEGRLASSDEQALPDKHFESRRGFVTANDFTTETVIDELYGDFFDPDCNNQKWDYRRRVILEAKKMFGPNFHTWLKRQVESGFLHGRRLQFIEDTIHFVLTGKREISIINWPALLSDLPPARPDLVPRNVMRQFSAVDTTKSTAAVISLWCAHPYGFDDMVCTLNILFGGSHLFAHQSVY